MRGSRLIAIATIAWALTGGIGVRAPFTPRCMAGMRCSQRPCCKIPIPTEARLRTRLPCCDPAPPATARAIPPGDHEVTGHTLLPVSTTIIALRPFAVRTPALVVAPPARGPPIYLRQRSLLL